MERSGKLIAVLIKCWTAKSPKTSVIVQNISGVIGIVALIALSIPSLGLPAWATLFIGVIAAISSALAKLRTTDNKNEIIKEIKKIIQDKAKYKK